MEAIQSPAATLGAWVTPISQKPGPWIFICLGIALTFLATQLSSPRPPSRQLPYVNAPSIFDVFAVVPRQRFVFHARDIFARARARYPGQLYRLMTDTGETIVIPSNQVHDVRKEPGLSFLEAFANSFHPHLPGFEALREIARPDELFLVVIKKHITKLLRAWIRFQNQITEPLAIEATYAFHHIFGDASTEWRECAIHPPFLELVARLSSRVFLGAEMCRNDDWLAITKSHSVTAFRAAHMLRPFPPWIRNVAHWFVPECRTLRRHVADSRRLLEPFLAERRRLRQQARDRGEPEPRFNDAMDWFEEEAAGRPYDPVATQLALAVSAIHSTADQLVEAMLRIAENPELFTPLRREIVEVIGTSGWSKAALADMTLMDSVLKETQRLKPVTSALMSRVATRPVTLPNGLKLQTGEKCVGDIGGMWDASAYPDPYAFDGWRFARMRGGDDAARDGGQAHFFVSTSPTHMGFGHGRHACPGRFLADNQLKVALSHLVMKYDWRLPEGHEHRWVSWGLAWSADEAAALGMRKREAPEMDLDSVLA